MLDWSSCVVDLQLFVVSGGVGSVAVGAVDSGWGCEGVRYESSPLWPTEE